MENIYSDLNSSIIRFLAQAYSEGNHGLLRKMGISEGQIQRMMDLPYSHIQRLHRLHSPIAEINFSNRLDLWLDHVSKEVSRDQMIDRMIQMGASASMLDALACIPVAEFRQRRKRLGLGSGKQGRPTALDSTEMLRVNEVYKEHQDESDELTRYYLIGLDTKIELNRVWAYMRGVQ